MSRRVGWLAVGMLVVSIPLHAQETGVRHERTTPAPDARYEILESGIAAKFTFRLDRFSGATAQLVQQADSTLTWEGVPRGQHPLPDTTIPGKPNYQIFSSGLEVRFTFLLNTNTGATWQLTQDSTGALFWSPLFTKPAN